jgi:hypothetical protein
MRGGRQLLVRCVTAYDRRQRLLLLLLLQELLLQQHVAFAFAATTDTSQQGRSWNIVVLSAFNGNRLAARATHREHCKKTVSLLSFPYACPEPVLVKRSFLYINAFKRPFSHLHAPVDRPKPQHHLRKSASFVSCT